MEDGECKQLFLHPLFPSSAFARKGPFRNRLTGVIFASCDASPARASSVARAMKAVAFPACCVMWRFLTLPPFHHRPVTFDVGFGNFDVEWNILTTDPSS